MKRAFALALLLACAHHDHKLVVVTSHPSQDRIVISDDGQVSVHKEGVDRSFKLGMAEFARVRRILLDPKLFEMRNVVRPREEGIDLDGGGQQFELHDGTRHHRFSIPGFCEQSLLPEQLAPACHLITEITRYPRSEPLAHPGEREHRHALVEMIEDYSERPTQTFWLLDDGEVIVREFRWDAEYRSFKLSPDELGKVLAVLESDELFPLKKEYGQFPPTVRVSHAADVELRFRRGAEAKQMKMVEVPMGECQVDAIRAFGRDPTPAPLPLVRACELIRQLQRDPRATPWFR